MIGLKLVSTMRQAVMSEMGNLRLGVNIDHVATLRNARGGSLPDPVHAAAIAARSGADGITAHLREDRRHIRDGDIERLAREIDLSGAFIALHHCFKSMIERKIIKKNPIIENLAAISCGIISGSCYLDLDYHEDQSADVDSNFVITESGKLVEVQLTSEGKICEEAQFNELLKIAKLGVAKIINEQKKVM